MYDTQGHEACVLVNGISVTEVDYNGSTYIEGRSGSNYELHFSNQSPTRVMVVPSVDGLNVLDGKPCGIESPGYIVGSNASIIIPGWRVDGSTAAKFQFRPRDGSYRSTYTESMGQSQENQGVIGFMVFKEKAPNYLSYWSTNRQHDPFFSPGVFEHGNTMGGYSLNTSSEPTNNTNDYVNISYKASEVGTGFGDATVFNTLSAEFEKESSFPITIMFMYYDTIRGLKKRGVPIERFQKSFTEEPNPFPASPSVYSGCKPPYGWKK